MTHSQDGKSTVLQEDAEAVVKLLFTKAGESQVADIVARVKRDARLPGDLEQGSQSHITIQYTSIDFTQNLKAHIYIFMIKHATLYLGSRKFKFVQRL